MGFKIWFIRIAVLMKLKYFNEAEQELKQNFDNFERPEFFYDSHTLYSSYRKGSMIPFGMRLLAAELPQFLAKFDESISELSRLLVIVNQIINQELSNCGQGISFENFLCINEILKR